MLLVAHARSTGATSSMFFLFCFLCPKVLIEKPAHTEREQCDGRQWAPARGTGTGTARLRVTCILKAAT